MSTAFIFNFDYLTGSIVAPCPVWHVPRMDAERHYADITSIARDLTDRGSDPDAVAAWAEDCRILGTATPSRARAAGLGSATITSPGPCVMIATDGDGHTVGTAWEVSPGRWRVDVGGQPLPWPCTDRAAAAYSLAEDYVISVSAW